MGSSASKSFEYDISEKYRKMANWWKLHDGVSKATQKEVSVFIFSKIEGAGNAASAANGFKRARTIKHPNFLKIISSFEDQERFCIVTEKVRPLEDVLETFDSHDKEEITLLWGIRQIAVALKFLHDTVGLAHSNFTKYAIYVDKYHFWQLGSLDFAQETDDSSKDRESFDEFVEYVFLTRKLRMPSQLRSIVDRRGGAQSRTMDVYLNSPLFKTKPQKVLDFAISIVNKTEEERNVFLDNLPEVWELLPRRIAILQVVPQIFYSLEMGIAQSNAMKLLTLCFEFPKEAIPREELEDAYSEHLINLLKSTERPVRSAMLKLLPKYKHLLGREDIQILFPLLKEGLFDVDVACRDVHLRSMVHILPNLDEKSVKEVVEAVFRLSKDKSGKVRTNSTILLGSSMSYFSKHVNEDDFVAFVRQALLDPFKQARLAGLKAVALNSQVMGLRNYSTEILPLNVILLSDKDAEVRAKAMNLLKKLIPTIEALQEQMNASDSQTPVDEQSGSRIKEYLNTYSLRKIPGKFQNLSKKGEPTAADSIPNEGENKKVEEKGTLDDVLAPDTDEIEEHQQQSDPEEEAPIADAGTGWEYGGYDDEVSEDDVPDDESEEEEFQNPWGEEFRDETPEPENHIEGEIDAMWDSLGPANDMKKSRDYDLDGTGGAHVVSDGWGW